MRTRKVFIVRSTLSLTHTQCFSLDRDSSGNALSNLKRAVERANQLLEHNLLGGSKSSPQVGDVDTPQLRFGSQPQSVVLSRHGALWWPARLSKTRGKDKDAHKVRIDFFGKPPTYEYVLRQNLIPFTRSAALQNPKDVLDTIALHELEDQAESVKEAEAYAYGSQVVLCTRPHPTGELAPPRGVSKEDGLSGTVAEIGLTTPSRETTTNTNGKTGNTSDAPPTMWSPHLQKTPLRSTEDILLEHRRKAMENLREAERKRCHWRGSKRKRKAIPTARLPQNCPES